MQSNNESFLARFGQAWSSAVARLSTRAALWSVLTRAPRHPVASLLDRQLQRERRLQVLPLSMAISLVLLFLIARIYLSVNEALIWSLPLLLMFFSAPHCVIWISRIVTLQSRGASDGVVDEVSMIPPGRIYIYLAICRVVLNADDALFWLHLLRRVLGGFVFLGLCFSLCIALTQMGTASAADIGRLLFEVLLVAVVIVLEHSQTIVLACLLAVAISPSVGGSIDRTSVTFVVFALLQLLSYAIAVGLVIVLNWISLSGVLILFLVARELLITVLWRQLLRQTNAGALHTSPEHWR